MGNHSVHKSLETGNFVVANKDGAILHTFPSEGEAMLQVQALDEQEKAAKQEPKEEAKAEKAEAKHHEANDEPKHGRHR